MAGDIPWPMPVSAFTTGIIPDMETDARLAQAARARDTALSAWVDRMNFYIELEQDARRIVAHALRVLEYHDGIRGPDGIGTLCGIEHPVTIAMLRTWLDSKRT